MKQERNYVHLDLACEYYPKIHLKATNVCIILLSGFKYLLQGIAHMQQEAKEDKARVTSNMHKIFRGTKMEKTNGEME